MSAFTAVRQLISHSPVDKNSLLQQKVKKLKEYVAEIFADQNDINEDTRLRLELINQTLAELQVKHKAAKRVKRPPPSDLLNRKNKPGSRFVKKGGNSSITRLPGFFFLYKVKLTSFSKSFLSNLGAIPCPFI